MLDLGWSELLVVAVLTVLIFGPKELPTVLRTVTQFVSKMKGMARDFQRTIDDVAREAELDKLKEEVTDAGGMNSMLDPTGTENDMFGKIFDDDEEDDGTPVRKSTSPVPGFDRAPETDTAEGESTTPDNPESALADQSTAAPSDQIVDAPVADTASVSKEGEAPAADDKKASSA
jgi:sec-independent protein translocase protein TatB